MEIVLGVNTTVTCSLRLSASGPASWVLTSPASHCLTVCVNDEGVREAPHEQGSGSSHHQPQGAMGTYQLAVKCADSIIISVLRNPYSHLQNLGRRKKIVSFDSSSTFNTIQSCLLGEKPWAMQDDSTVSWIMDWLAHRHSSSSSSRPVYWIHYGASQWCPGLLNCQLLSSLSTPLLLTFKSGSWQLHNLFDCSTVVGCIG